jgi:hypothetical protein
MTDERWAAMKRLGLSPSKLLAVAIDAAIEDERKRFIKDGHFPRGNSVDEPVVHGYRERREPEPPKAMVEGR